MLFLLFAVTYALSIPESYEYGDHIPMSMGSLQSSVRSPLEYYDMPVCRPDHIVQTPQSIFSTEQFFSSAFTVHMGVNRALPQCEVVLSRASAALLFETIHAQYRVHASLDGLPAFYPRHLYYEDRSDGGNVYELGWLLGVMVGDVAYMFTHLDFHLMYNGNYTWVVGFEVIPSAPIEVLEGTTLRYSYNVTWFESDISWVNRLDQYRDLWGNISDASTAGLFILLVALFLMASYCYSRVYRLARTDIISYASPHEPKSVQRIQLENKTCWQLSFMDCLPFMACVSPSSVPQQQDEEGHFLIDDDDTLEKIKVEKLTPGISIKLWRNMWRAFRKDLWRPPRFAAPFASFVSYGVVFVGVLVLTPIVMAIGLFISNQSAALLAVFLLVSIPLFFSGGWTFASLVRAMKEAESDLPQAQTDLIKKYGTRRSPNFGRSLLFQISVFVCAFIAVILSVNGALVDTATAVSPVVSIPIAAGVMLTLLGALAAMYKVQSPLDVPQKASTEPSHVEGADGDWLGANRHILIVMTSLLGFLPGVALVWTIYNVLWTSTVVFVFYVIAIEMVVWFACTSFLGLMLVYVFVNCGYWDWSWAVWRVGALMGLYTLVISVYYYSSTVYGEIDDRSASVYWTVSVVVSVMIGLSHGAVAYLNARKFLVALYDMQRKSE